MRCEYCDEQTGYNFGGEFRVYSSIGKGEKNVRLFVVPTSCKECGTKFEKITLETIDFLRTVFQYFLDMPNGLESVGRVGKYAKEKIEETLYAVAKIKTEAASKKKERAKLEVASSEKLRAGSWISANTGDIREPVPNPESRVFRGNTPEPNTVSTQGE